MLFLRASGQGLGQDLSCLLSKVRFLQCLKPSGHVPSTSLPATFGPREVSRCSEAVGAGAGSCGRAAEVEQRQATRETAGEMCKPPIHQISTGETQGLEEKGLFGRLCSTQGTPCPSTAGQRFPCSSYSRYFGSYFRVYPESEVFRDSSTHQGWK